MISLHPSETAGTGQPIEQAQYHDPRDRPDHHRQCAMCGFQFDDDVNQRGDSLFSPGIQYSPVAGTALQSQLLNGDFEIWSNGTVWSGTINFGQQIADNWFFNSVMSGIYFVTVSRYSLIKNTGTYSLQMGLSTIGTSTTFLAQQTLANPKQYANQKVSLTMACAASVSNAQFALTDGIQTVYSAFFPNTIAINNNFTSQTINLQVSQTPTKLQVLIGQFGNIQIGNMYFDTGSLLAPYIPTEPVVVSGCPFCGTYNPEGSLVGSEFGSDVDITNL